MSYQTALASFPHESVPDGAIFAPHHLYVGALLALLALAVMWDDRDDDPWLAAGALAALLFAFVTIWPFYPVTGASLSLVATGVALVAPSLRLGYWRDVVRRRTAIYVLGVLVAADDVLEHALGIPTPLDWLWVNYIHQHII